jgi:putative nucleotidyltransferase with HDIG domain
MTRILFVDDEEQVLEGLRDTLRRQRNVWELEFALGGDAALAELAESHFDVVVSDMRMPGMDGAELLTRVADLSPDTARIILSGQTDLQAALRAARVAHQFLSKPCGGDELCNVLRRVLGLRDLVISESIREAVGRIRTLPSPPTIYADLMEALQSAETSASDVSRIVCRDAALAAKLLQIANSSFFGLPRRLDSVREAVVYLGTTVIRGLFLSSATLRMLEGADGWVVSGESIHEHAVLVARVSERLLPEHQEAAFTAGLLHDIGKIVFLVEYGERYDALLNERAPDLPPLPERERDAFDVSHPEIGAYLLNLWGLPYPIIEAVAYHHSPEQVEQSTFGLLAAVHVADALVDDAQGDRLAADLDAAFLESLGVAGSLDEWRELTAEVVNGEVQ